MTPATPPQDPTAPPNTIVPVGWTSLLGVYSTAALAIVALVAAILNGDHSQETLLALAGAVITLVSTLAGRFAQAVAIYRAKPGLGSIVEAAEIVNAPYPPPKPVPPVPPV